MSSEPIHVESEHFTYYFEAIGGVNYAYKFQTAERFITILVELNEEFA